MDTKHSNAPALILRRGDDVAARCREDWPGARGADFDGVELGDFMRAVSGSASEDLTRKALSAGNGAAGGHLVPTALLPGILEPLTATSALFQAGTPIEVLAAGAKTVTKPAVLSLPVPAWRDEAAAVAESDPVFRAVTATPRSLAVRFKVSRELLMDAPDIDGALSMVLGRALALALDRAGLMGSGTAPEPRGLRNTAGVMLYGPLGTRTEYGSSSSLLPAASGGGYVVSGNALWPFVHAMADLQMTAAPEPTALVTSARQATYLRNVRDRDRNLMDQPEGLRRLQIVGTPQVPDVTVTSGDLTINGTADAFLGDFRLASLVLREEVSIERLTEAHATTGQVGFIAHLRADFVCWYPGAFCVMPGIHHAGQAGQTWT
jgi:HK97 family phage major capsid protein